MPASFSSRAPKCLLPNRLTQIKEHLELQGVSLVDLTVANPTLMGFQYPPGLLSVLGSSEALLYKPDPSGLRSAREAVATYLRRHEIPVEAEDLLLTTSTSEAYAFLLKLLCDPGHEVFVPRPSYPLLEYLLRFESVVSTTYELKYHGRWEINVPELESQLTAQTRALVLVNPNNPTGSFVSAGELEGVFNLCRKHGLALIVDEVFGFYSMVETKRGPSVLDFQPDVLTFVLGGLSKAVGLPGLKMGWIVVAGPPKERQVALNQLELISDTYLSVATPVQLAAEHLLLEASTVTDQISQRVRNNYEMLAKVVSSHPAANLIPVEGGWYAVVQFPSTVSEEALVVDLLESDHILVYPGYFFDFFREGFLVVSLISPLSVFEPAVKQVLARAFKDS